MIPIQGIWRDSPLRIQPKGFSPDVRNMVINKELGVYSNEPGFDVWSTYLLDNGLNCIGIASVNYGRKVVFSVTEDNLSEIGVFDSDAIYTRVIKYDLGFNVNNPMDIEYEYDAYGNLIVAFTDNLNSPKVINIDSPPSPFAIERIEMFPSTKGIKISSDVIENGGNLTSGAYYPVFKYRNYDLSESGWSEIGNPVYITNSNSNSDFDRYDGCPGGTGTNKAIVFTVSNVDTNYDKIILGVIYKNSGVLSVIELTETIVSGDTITATLINTSTGTIDSLADVLTPHAFYNRVRHLTQTNGVLYIADLGEASPLNLQKYISLIKLKWQSTLLENPFSLPSSYKVNDLNNKMKGYMHEEVYAIYCRAKLIKGGWTNWFICVGNAAGTVEGKSWNDDANISDIVAYDSTLQVDLSINSNCKYFQTRDTTKNIDTGTGIGDFGFWENQNETYPDLPEYDSSGIGGENLRGQPVRHYRFPTIRKLKTELYSSYDRYGLNQLDVLGIVVDSFPTFPDEIASLIEGYEFGYAKRNAANSTVAGQDIVINGAARDGDRIPYEDRTAYSSSGNWKNQEISGGNLKPDENMSVNPNYYRFHSFDLMFGKPAVGVSYISNQLFLTQNNIQGHLFSKTGNDFGFHIDYVQNVADSTATALINPDEFLISIKDFQYVPNNVITGKINNLRCEGFAFGQLVYGHNRIVDQVNQMIFGTNNGGPLSTLGSESTYLTNLMVYKQNMYTSFYNQQLVSTGTYFLLTDTPTVIYGGDIFISRYGFVTYGPRILRDIPGSLEPWSFNLSPDAGVKVLRGFMCESYNNIGLRNEQLGNQYTKYYPKEPAMNPIWFSGWDVTNDFNQIAYNTDYSSVNDLNTGIPFDPYSQFINEHPNRLARCIPSSNEQRQISWKNFLANDYFELQKNRGKITNIQGTSENYVFINTEFSLFKTVGTEQLQTNEFQVVLGTGDIFGRPPTESNNDEHGYAGCQHKYSCLLTSFGYFFLDADKKKVYLTGKGLEVQDITTGLVNFFNANIQPDQDNPYQAFGYTSMWDDRYKRILLSFTNITQFTLSFTPEARTWTSFHDYVPFVFFNERHKTFSLFNGTIYQHNSSTFRGIYYNEEAIYPSYFVQVFNTVRPEYPYGKGYRPDGQIKAQELISNVVWKTDVILNGGKLRDLTIDRILLWNSYQSTDDTQIIPFDNTKSLLYNQASANTRRKKDIWNFNSIRDVVIDNTRPFVVDSEVQEDNVDITRSFELKKRFADDFLAVKFLFSNNFIDILQPDFNFIDAAVNSNIVSR